MSVSGLAVQERRLFQLMLANAMADPQGLSDSDIEMLRKARRFGWDRGDLAEQLMISASHEDIQRARRILLAVDHASDDVDMVNNPRHYEQGPFECIELTERYQCCLSNAIRYVFRHRMKWNPVEDLNKALWYVDRAIKRGDRFAPIGGMDAVTPLGNRATFDMLDQLTQLNWAGACKFWLGLMEQDQNRTRAALTELIESETQQH
ncbi:DUF3310 domain-containing protein [Bifidobacterium sp. SO1]|uniref:DUF3310 domain-containing protein n=1 Tax=Bifidobacterium sp. SO1 TaxID=2809029 RepID=UPI001BDBEF40|nr:DUF3310 domain-containing protein [Bifidobacterium sp. SO1]MBT1162153.1 DUF3310 domain-containing protein [Bifidobacterium sp. SO1]